jgi:hypothetical protein
MYTFAYFRIQLPDDTGCCRMMPDSEDACWAALDAEVWDPAFNHFQWCLVVFLKM